MKKRRVQSSSRSSQLTLVLRDPLPRDPFKRAIELADLAARTEKRGDEN